jgi:hypothetical protein
MLEIMQKVVVYKYQDGQYVKMKRDFPWKRGIVFTCKSILELQNHLLLENDYKCVFLGHFTQDGVENLFSQIRSKLTNPTPSQAINCLKKIAIGRYMEEVPTSSYEFANGLFTLDLHNCIEKPKKKESYSLEILPLTKDHDEDILVFIYGACVFSILKVHVHSCTCRSHMM